MPPDATQPPKRARIKKPEPPGASTKRADKLRAERTAQGLAEVRGIWAKPEHHASIKALAEQVNKPQA